MVEDRIGRGAWLLGQFLDHVDRAIVMGDHQVEELAVEVCSFRSRQRGELRRGRHALHGRTRAAGARMVHRAVVHRGVVHRGEGEGLAAPGQPVAHELGLVLLRRDDPCRDGSQLRIVGPRRCQRGHLHRLLMMDDHHLHEADVGRGEAGVGDA